MSESAYRDVAFEAHGRECWKCGAEDELQVHHRDGDRTNNDAENLLPLCRTCHSNVHNGILEDLADELLPPGQRPQIDSDTTTYQFDIPEHRWEEWKNTVPRSKSLDERLRELIKADTGGRVQESNND